MRHWKVISTDGPAIPTLTGGTWIEALGHAIEESGGDQHLERLVCEKLPNGTVIARDARSGRRWVVRETAAPAQTDVVLASVVSLVLAVAAATTGLALF